MPPAVLWRRRTRLTLCAGTRVQRSGDGDAHRSHRSGVDGGKFTIRAESRTVACINSRVDRRRRVARVSDEHHDDGTAFGRHEGDAPAGRTTGNKFTLETRTAAAVANPVSFVFRNAIDIVVLTATLIYNLKSYSVLSRPQPATGELGITVPHYKAQAL
ncbi:hypothetical protein QTP88_022545 [Uroleucon formosanum]